MYRLDSHIHCQYSPDSSTKIDDIIKKSIEDKIDIIAISDHNTVEGSKVLLLFFPLFAFSELDCC